MNAKVLIVDDDEDITTMLEDRLRASGYSTLVAGDGLQALEKVELESPSLMLLAWPDPSTRRSPSGEASATEGPPDAAGPARSSALSAARVPESRRSSTFCSGSTMWTAAASLRRLR